MDEVSIDVTPFLPERGGRRRRGRGLQIDRAGPIVAIGRVYRVDLRDDCRLDCLKILVGFMNDLDGNVVPVGWIDSR